MYISQQTGSTVHRLLHAMGNCLSTPPPYICAEYELVSELGTGANATVWLARHKPSQALFALKLVPRNFSEWRRVLISREIEIQSHFNHVSIVGLHACILTKAYLGIVME